VLLENANEGGGFDMDSTEGRLVSPGHGLECCWFLLGYARRVGDRALERKLCAMVEGQFAFGTDREYGGIYYFMDALGKPPMELQHDMKLWWVHNEATLAALYAYRASGDERFLARFREVDAWSFEHFPDPEHGEWYAYLNRRGEPSIRAKGGKWKTFFHLPRMLLQAVRVMKEI
jgi:N-acylglucosamine 2-epimerase